MRMIAAFFALFLLSLAALVTCTVDHIESETRRATFNGGISFEQCAANVELDCTRDF